MAVKEGKLDFWWKRPVRDFEAEDCRDRLKSFLLCTILKKDEGGEQAPSCQKKGRKLEKLCAKYRSSWSAWSVEYMNRYCTRQVEIYASCVNTTREWKGKGLPDYRKRLEEICPAMHKQIAAASGE